MITKIVRASLQDTCRMSVTVCVFWDLNYLSSCICSAVFNVHVLVSVHVILLIRTDNTCHRLPILMVWSWVSGKEKNYVTRHVKSQRHDNAVSSLTQLLAGPRDRIHCPWSSKSKESESKSLSLVHQLPACLDKYQYSLNKRWYALNSDCLIKFTIFSRNLVKNGIVRPGHWLC